jgi:hypothetical protein
MLQRYRIYNCADIAEDDGPYCLSEDVAEIEKAHSRVIDSHLFISHEEFKELATFAMCNDSPNQDANMEVIHSILDQIAVKCLNFDDWIQAYHEL